MELVRPIPQPTPQTTPQSGEAVHDRSALASARLHRQLTVEEAARRAGLTPDQVQWLEEGRVYRFPSADAALEATLLLAPRWRSAGARPARSPACPSRRARSTSIPPRA